jgi:hypothetical protein
MNKKNSICRSNLSQYGRMAEQSAAPRLTPIHPAAMI